MQIIFNRKRVVVYIILLVGLLALASSMMATIWDGGFPSGEFRILVVDEQGQPIPGATLRVFASGTRGSANKYPIYENGVDGVTAGADGVVVCHQPRQGIQFSGTSWELFWLIPMGDSAPQFDFEFSKEGYRTRVLTNDEFFHEGIEYDDKAYDAAQKVMFTWSDPEPPWWAENETLELPVWHRKVTLSSK